jgi:DNA-directed RNA polymerase specialized sigma subunit
MQTEKKNFFIENKKVFKKHLSKRAYEISQMRWELNKNSEEIAKELGLKTQEVFILLSCINK